MTGARFTTVDLRMSVSSSRSSWKSRLPSAAPSSGGGPGRYSFFSRWDESRLRFFSGGGAFCRLVSVCVRISERTVTVEGSPFFVDDSSTEDPGVSVARRFLASCCFAFVMAIARKPAAFSADSTRPRSSLSETPRAASFESVSSPRRAGVL
jgi:hypothetical protein